MTQRHEQPVANGQLNVNPCRIGAARVVFVAPRRRTQIRQFWRGRYWADVGGEFLLLVAAVMI